MYQYPFTLTTFVFCIACATAPFAASGEDDRPAWSAPVLDRAVSVRDGRTDAILTFEAFLDAIENADVVFLGETHDDETTHRVELAVYDGLLARRDGRVVLAMEMFERDVQQDLDSYLKGEIDEATFLARVRPWGNYRTAYRPLVERAKASGRAVVASNFPRPLQMRVAMQGPKAIETLQDDAKHQAPTKLFPNTEAYWRRVDNAVRSHPGMAGGGNRDKDRLYSTQSLWDNAMGEACAIALDKHPGNTVLHVNGDFHTAYWDGTVHQFRARKPKARVKTVSIVPVPNPAVAELKGAPSADYVVFAEARATDPNEGTWSVHVGREVKYRFHLPKGASAESPVPLLIWLSDDGFTAADGLDLWKDRLGEEAAIAVLEAPYRAIQEDLGVGGQWFWPDTFSSDIDSLVNAVERVWGYLMRHYPIDSTRVCLAGEGTGATVVAAVTLLTDRMEVEALALAPRRYAKIKDFSLPLPEFRGDDTSPKKSLRVVGGKEVEAWWATELAEYTKIGLDSKMVLATTDPWQRETQAENAMRDALGLERRPAVAAKTRRYILVEGDSPRARHWARLHALWSTAEDGVAVVETPPEDATASRISTEIRPEAFAAPDALPRCPGPFGGTTVVVLPEDVLPRDSKAWLALEKDDPIARESRFHRLRIATADGERSLANVLAKLQSVGHKNILIIPAVFSADPAWMRVLRRSVRHVEDQMTLRWQPGLGGRKAALSTSTSSSAAVEAPVRHRLSVVLEPDTHRVIVRDKIQLPPSLCHKGAEFTLNAALTIQKSDPPVAKVAGKEDFEVRYALKAAPTDGVMSLSYDGTINFGLSQQKEEYTRGFRETRGIVGPKGVYLDGDSAWVPRFDERLIRFAVEVRMPDEWHVISQGKGTSRDGEGRAAWESEGAMEQVYLVGGPLHKESDTAGAVEVLVYLHERDDALARTYLDTTARYLEMYRQLIGPYPYSKFAVVENFWETGYGMPSFSLLGPQVIRFPFILHSSHPHEILHNWWGNSVFVDYEHGNWCEGLTAYLADHLIQEQRGQGAEYRRNTLQKYRDYVKEGHDFRLSEFRSRHNAATEAVGYGKALMTFHMLRRHMGDDRFRAALAGFYRKYRGKRASFDDLRRALEGVADEDLSPFFAQWVKRTGAPTLALSDISVRVVQGGFAVTGSLDQGQKGEPFALEVPVIVRTKDSRKTFVIETRARSQAFELKVASRPQSLSADPSFDVFRQLDPRETPASIGQIFGQSRILAVLPAASGDRAQLDRYRQLMEAWRSDDHAIELADDTKLKTLPDDRAIWILGKKNRFAEDLLDNAADAAVADSGASLKLGGEEVPFADHCIVVVQRHPRNAEQAIGWLVVEPAAASAGMARKLPHYGKYSYLAFEGKEPTNVLKGQWDTRGSPLVVDLRQKQDNPLKPLPAETRAPLAKLPPVFARRALVSHVDWLSAPEREGRGLGTKGLSQAAEYIAKSMAAAGLKPGGDKGSWFQRFTVANGPEGKPVETVNVVGVLPGGRADWSDQSVVLGAHYDHLGRGWPDVHSGDEGKVHPGADDNASGIAVLLELARNLAAAGGGSRNLVVVAFSAEECGRHGSRHYVQHPRFPVEGIRGMINLDTVGRLFDQKLAIHGTGTADEWPHIFRGCSYVTGIESKNVPEAAGGSDQMSFIEKGIPGVQVFTGAHSDYHRPTDTLDKIDGTGLVKVATLVKEAVTYLLEREAPLMARIDGASTTKPPAGGGRKVLFGAVPAFEFQGVGVKIDSLVANSPAASAGLRAGDVIVRLDNTDIRDLRAFSEFLKTLKPGEEVQATVLRDGVKVSARVKVKKR